MTTARCLPKPGSLAVLGDVMSFEQLGPGGDRVTGFCRDGNPVERLGSGVVVVATWARRAQPRRATSANRASIAAWVEIPLL